MGLVLWAFVFRRDGMEEQLRYCRNSNVSTNLIANGKQPFLEDYPEDTPEGWVPAIERSLDLDVETRPSAADVHKFLLTMEVGSPDASLLGKPSKKKGELPPLPATQPQAQPPPQQSRYGPLVSASSIALDKYVNAQHPNWTLHGFLSILRLQRFEEAFDELGVGFSEDLLNVEEQMLIDMGMKPLQRKKMLDSVTVVRRQLTLGSQWID
eukprot:TRINITY_DN2060_c0_g2_i6.p2 TRINITY_DN2060_c0_g2~~TRINITY_DN2060_c0_g2_i6.p2  ORF type:complete len:210 (+),score=56.64 TRINITY_DN2060_c0_g2_i6:1365-1994(+)